MRTTGQRPIGAVARQARAQFAADVRYYLTQDPRQLPSRYFYDDLGSALFEAICRLPWYGLMRAELRLLTAHAREILDHDISTVVELGPGRGEKLGALLAAGSRNDALDLHLIDISGSALADAAYRLGALGDLRVVTHQTTYEVGMEEFGREAATGRSLAVFLGSNIGNFDPPAREALLRSIRATLRPGDRLLLGADLVKPELDLLLAYDDPLGITAAFNRNLLVRINHELGGTFELDGFAHRVVWNREHSRVEMHLISRRAQRVEIAAAQLGFEMREDESIWTESSYKFEPVEIAALLERCRFRVAAQWIDTPDLFALTYAEAVSFADL